MKLLYLWAFALSMVALVAMAEGKAEPKAEPKPFFFGLGREGGYESRGRWYYSREGGGWGRPNYGGYGGWGREGGAWRRPVYHYGGSSEEYGK